MAAGLAACGSTDSVSSPDSLPAAPTTSLPGDSSLEQLESELSVPDTTEGAPSDTGDTSVESLPSWAGDYTMPPPLVVRGLDEATLEPWTWGWTSPPNDDGEQESIVADGVPLEPLQAVTNEGFVDLVYPLSNWTFNARVEGDDSLLPIEATTEDGDSYRLDLAEVVDGSTITIVGLASPGYYELVVSFTAVRALTPDPSIETFEVSPANPGPGDTFEATFDADNLRGGYFTLQQWSGSEWLPAVFLLESDAETQPATWSTIEDGIETQDYGIEGVGPDGLVMPDDLDAGIWRLCTANARDEACAQLVIGP